MLRIATRASPLARWQANALGDALRGSDKALAIEMVFVKTEPERRTEIPIWRLGGKGAFVKEVQEAVLAGRAEIAVHSAKDLPAETPAGLEIAAVLPRGDPRDVLVGSTLERLAPGTTVATGAPRRRAQLAHLRPDLTFSELRGNIGTRLARARRDPVVVAAAALDRLDTRLDLPHETLRTELFVPQVGQAVVAAECRADDPETQDRLAAVDHRQTRLSFETERAFLVGLGGDCDLPCGALASLGDNGSIHIDCLLAALDGRTVLRTQLEGTDPHELGSGAARFLLEDSGGSALATSTSP